MKNTKNSIWLSLSVIFFLIFIIALFAIGFKFDNSADGGKILWTLADVLEQTKVDGALAMYRVAAILMITALALASVNVVLVITKWVLDELNIKTKMKQTYWDYLFLGINSLCIILIVAGASVFVAQYRNDTQWENATLNTGRIAGFYILTILTVPLSAIPLFLPNPAEPAVASETPTSETPKSEEKKTTIVIDNPEK